MIIDAKKLSSYSVEDIFKSTYKSLKSLYNEFIYLNMKEEEFKDIIKNKIEESFSSYNNEINYIDYLRNSVITELTKMIKLTYERDSYDLLYNFITQKYAFTDTLKQVIYAFNHLNEFLEKYNLTLNDKLIKQLIIDCPTFFENSKDRV